MKIKYSVKFRDYFFYNMWHQLLSIPCQLLYISLSLFISHYQFIESGVFAGIVTFVMVYVLLWIFQQVINFAMLISKNNKSIITNHEIEIQKNAFVESTKYNKSFHYWPGVVKVSSYPGLVAVYVSAHGAHIVPARAFDSSENKAEFIRDINEAIALANN